ncbi:MAG TPA: response regulator [Steroidobacteraceae bacterium]|jgi:CheY-like chemotaxis protein|nr:response regulator [Steroidobacteraceae bacterium]
MQLMHWTQLENDHPDDASSPHSVYAARRRANPNTTRVLIADDYADAAKSLAMLLAIAGIETAIAMDGEEALAVAESWHPDICLIDLLMPKVDGLAVARRIREQDWSSRPLLIALTGRTTAQDRHSAAEAGFDHYMMKPADPATLVRTIQSYTSGDRCPCTACDTPYP